MVVCLRTAEAVVEGAELWIALDSSSQCVMEIVGVRTNCSWWNWLLHDAKEAVLQAELVFPVRQLYS